MNITLTKTFKQALKLMEHGNGHLFITGRAGTGKSTLLKHFKDTTQKNVVFVAPTGVAAIHIEGVTIHSFFEFPFGMVTSGDIEMKYHKKKLFQSMETLVIDEVSMVRADVMWGINETLKLHRDNSAPFGGVQVIMFGDPYQLPPVVVGQQEASYLQEVFGGKYFFHGLSFDLSELTQVHLDKNFRQKKDQTFLSILNNIRENKVTDKDLTLLNEQVLLPNRSPKKAIVLTTTNKLADTINKKELAKLTEKEHVFTAIIEGDFDTKKAPGAYTLRLKKGAQVMMIKNDVQTPRRWANGTLGEITEIKKDKIFVAINGQTHEVDRATWEEFEYTFDHNAEEVTRMSRGTFVQYPMKLAWAVTIHKSQGKTFDRIVVDLGRRAFAHGQTYVALSRCRSLKNTYLKRPVYMRDIIVDAEVSDFLGG